MLLHEERSGMEIRPEFPVVENAPHVRDILRYRRAIVEVRVRAQAHAFRALAFALLQHFPQAGTVAENLDGGMRPALETMPEIHAHGPRQRGFFYRALLPPLQFQKNRIETFLPVHPAQE